MRIIGPRPVEHNGLRGFVTTFEFGNHHSQAPEHKAAGHAPRNEGSDGANAGGNDVDRSTERAGHAGQPFDALTGQFEPRNRIEIVERNTSGPDAKRASNSHSAALPPGATEAGSVQPSADPATHHASRNGEG